jgi:hypothetical protein
MNADILIHVLSLCVVLACAETLHGIVRIKFVIPWIGKESALKLSAVTGSLLAFLICFWLVPDVGLSSRAGHLALGGVLAAFMAAFDIAIGRFLMRKSWTRIWPDFDPRTGNYLLFGLLFLVWAPFGVALLRGIP